jgi:transposase
VPVDPESLPEDSKILRQMIVDLTRQLDKTNQLLQKVLAARTGTRSEQLSADQLRLFAQELGIETAEETEERRDKDSGGKPPTTSNTSERKKPRGRQPLAPHLKREHIVHDLDEAEKRCTSCHQQLRHIGEEVSERYEYVPAQMLVIEEACQKYACACTVRTAAKPAQPIEKSTASASVLAQVIISKIADHLPVHRQVKMFRRWGVELPDQTLCGWLRQSAELLEPLYDRMKAFVLSSKVVGTDDTPVKVLDRALPHTRKGRFWPYVGDGDHPAVVYDYTPTRERAGPEKFLSTYKGYLQLDAYPAYDKFFTEPGRELVEVGCWAHARRHVFQSRDTDPARMGALLAYIAQLYAVEKRARQCGIAGEDLRLLRETASRPVSDHLHSYLLRIQAELLPKSDAGQAVAYILKNWPALTRYLDDAALPIDNNRTERSLRGIAVGRNNWTFLGSDRGGKTMAILRSFVTSCEINKVDPFAWFRDVLGRIASHSIQQLEQLFPHNWPALAG